MIYILNTINDFMNTFYVDFNCNWYNICFQKSTHIFIINQLKNCYMRELYQKILKCLSKLSNTSTLKGEKGKRLCILDLIVFDRVVFNIYNLSNLSLISFKWFLVNREFILIFTINHSKYHIKLWFCYFN